jgi:hypothetical protein
MLLGDDVLNVERQEVGIVFVKPAVVTATAGPLPDEGPKSGVHHSPWELGEKLAGFGLEDGDERTEGHVVTIFGPLFGSEQSLIATPGQVIHAVLQLGICFQGQEPPSRLRGQAFAKGANKPVESWSSIHRFHAEILPLRWQGAK